ncbi:MAG: hypothetical protein OEY86_12995 [Nitrospira sp.]|nr:hypothetical protein [Nitrospira sp.]
MAHVRELFVTAHCTGKPRKELSEKNIGLAGRCILGKLGSYVQCRLLCNDRTVIAHETLQRIETEAVVGVPE